VTLIQAILGDLLGAFFLSATPILVTFIAGGLSIYLGYKNRFYWGAILIVFATVTIQLVYTSLYSANESNIVDRIYQASAMRGYLYWSILFSVWLLLLKYRKSYWSY
jgi:hypothetical protein